jgi:hypothetical protein
MRRSLSVAFTMFIATSAAAAIKIDRILCDPPCMRLQHRDNAPLRGAQAVPLSLLWPPARWMERS